MPEVHSEGERRIVLRLTEDEARALTQAVNYTNGPNMHEIWRALSMQVPDYRDHYHPVGSGRVLKIEST